MSTQPETNAALPDRGPECSECGINTQQFRRLKAFAKQVTAVNADTLGTIAAAQMALDGDLGGGNASLVGKTGFVRPKPGAKAPAVGPVPAGA